MSSIELVEPAPLPRGLHGTMVVGAAHPVDGLACRHAVQNREGGEGCSGPPAAAPAGNLHAFAGVGEPMCLTQTIESVAAVDGDLPVG